MAVNKKVSAEAKKVVEVKKAVEVKEVAPVKEEAVEVAEVKETASKKASTKKTNTKKVELKSAFYVQYEGKSYSQDDLMKMAKDVWKYDLKKKSGDLKSVELYVKTEENKVYYVMNDEFTGSFDI